MKTRSTQKGFTLVELAIVMTIIGLLIGGVLKGQELMQNARVTSTVAQVKAYEAAVTTFRDKYDATPGDMTNANTRIPNCGTACNAASVTAPNLGGDGIVGLLNYAGTSGTNVPVFTTQTQTSLATPATAASTAAGFETNLFWVHLLLSDLIGGVTNNSINATAAGTTASAWGTTHPAAKIAGGFVVGFGNGVPTPGGTAVAGTGISGMMLAMLSAPTTTTAANMIVSGNQPLSATRAAQIDRKMDDGKPGSGFVQAYGTTTSCFTSTTALTYAESITTNDCGLLFRIQG